MRVVGRGQTEQLGIGVCKLAQEDWKSASEAGAEFSKFGGRLCWCLLLQGPGFAGLLLY